MILTAEKRVIIMVTLLALVVLSIIFFIIAPTIKDIYATKENAHQLRAYLEETYQRTKNLRTSKERVEEIKSAIPEFREHIFFQGEELKLITLLEDLAAKNNLEQRIENSNLDDSVANRIRISTNLTGKYRDLLKYLSALDSAPYFFNVTGLRFSPILEKGDSVPTTFSLSLTINIYANQ